MTLIMVELQKTDIYLQLFVISEMAIT